MIRFEPITQDNMNDAIAISVHPDQEDIIAPVVYSLAQCYVLSDILTPFLIMNDDLPVGFILFLIAPKEEEYELCRLMSAQKQQKKGYGREALLLAIQYLADAGAKKIELSHQTNNYGVGKLYESVGFHYTGVIEDGEVMMEMVIKND